ncbi:MAG: NADH:ubiquinone oxidoreductase subunit A [Gammaproteobacteria bacterium]|nr:NADH:ubiquinone oxidoreductase subunit A [Gammaproteobacteria bacterium]
MNFDRVQAENLGPIAVYFLLVLVVVAVMLAIPHIIAQRGRSMARDEPFESGVVSLGDTHLHLGVHFYPVAIFFVIFDLEAIFIFAWAVAFRELGWAGYLEMLVFVSVLLATLVYLWKVGALEWRTRRQRLQDGFLSD